MKKDGKKIKNLRTLFGPAASATVSSATAPVSILRGTCSASELLLSKVKTLRESRGTASYSSTISAAAWEIAAELSPLVTPVLGPCHADPGVEVTHSLFVALGGRKQPYR